MSLRRELVEWAVKARQEDYGWGQEDCTFSFRVKVDQKRLVAMKEADASQIIKK
jgi:hypothetical protein